MGDLYQIVFGEEAKEKLARFRKAFRSANSALENEEVSVFYIEYDDHTASAEWTAYGLQICRLVVNRDEVIKLDKMYDIAHKETSRIVTDSATYQRIVENSLKSARIIYDKVKNALERDFGQVRQPQVGTISFGETN